MRVLDAGLSKKLNWRGLWCHIVGIAKLKFIGGLSVVLLILFGGIDEINFSDRKFPVRVSPDSSCYRSGGIISSKDLILICWSACFYQKH